MRAALALLAAFAAAPAAPAGTAAAGSGAATVVLAARSIGSRRGEPLDPRAHAALLVRLDGRPGGFIVQGGKEPAPATLFGSRHRVAGWAIPCQEPAAEVAREEPFATALGHAERRPSLLTPEEYALLLHRLGFVEQHVRLVVYAHLLPSREAVIEWVKGQGWTVLGSMESPIAGGDGNKEYLLAAARGIDAMKKTVLPTGT